MCIRSSSATWIPSVFSSVVVSVGLLCGDARGQDANQENRSSPASIDWELDWSKLPDLPDELGVAGPFVGLHNQALIVAGGANFPQPVWETTKTWHDRIHVLADLGNHPHWVDGGKLESPVGYGAAVSTPEGVVCIGGNDATQTFQKVFLLRWNRESQKIERIAYPSLPQPCAYAQAAVLGEKIYLIGGQSDLNLDSATRQCWSLDLRRRSDPASFHWELETECPGPPRALHMVAVQSVEGFDHLFVMSGRYQAGEHVRFLKDIHQYNPRTKEWRQLPDLPRPMMAGIGSRLGPDHLVVVGGDDGRNFTRVDELKDRHPGFIKEAFALNVRLGRWESLGTIPQNQVTTIPVLWDERLLVVSGEIRPRVRTPAIWSVALRRKPQACVLTKQAIAQHPIIIAPHASEASRYAAKRLSEYLRRITGVAFTVREGDASNGIVVGSVDEFPSLDIGGDWWTPKAEDRENYLLRTEVDRVLLLGSSEKGVVHAVWAFLDRIGYRQYFPGSHWEIVPSIPELVVALDVVEQPDYHARRIWYGYGPWDYAAAPYADWCEKNRATSGIELNSGHAYDRFVAANKKQFELHPEYWPLLGGERKEVRNPKPCLGNPELRALFVDHALRQFDKEPSLDSISVDPSDGGGWCECQACAQLGSVTDQAITLANEVATAVEARYPGKRIGMYAYNFHSSPPRLRVHPNVVISVATAFIKGGESLEDIIRGWSRQGATLGIREYYSVHPWDRDQPAQARGGNPTYLRKTIADFHRRGARFMSAESSDNWGPNGLGYYLAARCLWDIDQADRLQGWIDDFFQKAFGTAEEPMREFYDQLDGSKPHLVVDDQLGRMHRCLKEARGLTVDPGVHARLDDLTQYAHYCSLFHRYSMANGDQRQAAFEQLIRHAYRMRTSMLVHTKALYRDLVRRDKTVSIPSGAEYDIPEPKNPWKSSLPFLRDELNAMLDEGIAQHPLVVLPFQPRSYSQNLVPAAGRLGWVGHASPGELGAGRGEQVFYLYLDTDHKRFELRITGGMIPHYRDRGNVRLDLWKIGGASETGERETLTASDRSVPPDGQQHAVSLTVPETGLYRLQVNDGNDQTKIEFPSEIPVTIWSGRDQSATEKYSQWMQYFYVPKGTKVIGVYGGEHGEIRDSQDRPHFWFNGREPNYYNVSIPPGEDGKVWHVKHMKGPLRLLTVPPCFAPTPQQLLLPAEVVEDDEQSNR